MNQVEIHSQKWAKNETKSLIDARNVSFFLFAPFHSLALSLFHVPSFFVTLERVRVWVDGKGSYKKGKKGNDFWWLAKYFGRCVGCHCFHGLYTYVITSSQVYKRKLIHTRTHINKHIIYNFLLLVTRLPNEIIKIHKWKPSCSHHTAMEWMNTKKNKKKKKNRETVREVGGGFRREWMR